MSLSWQNQPICSWWRNERHHWIDSELNDSVVLAALIRQAVADIKLELAGEAVQFTISFGMESYQTDNENVDDILQKAGVKLYQAKESRRNKVCV